MAPFTRGLGPSKQQPSAAALLGRNPLIHWHKFMACLSRTGESPRRIESPADRWLRCAPYSWAAAPEHYGLRAWAAFCPISRSGVRVTRHGRLARGLGPTLPSKAARGGPCLLGHHGKPLRRSSCEGRQPSQLRRLHFDAAAAGVHLQLARSDASWPGSARLGPGFPSSLESRGCGSTTPAGLGGRSPCRCGARRTSESTPPGPEQGLSGWSRSPADSDARKPAAAAVAEARCRSRMLGFAGCPGLLPVAAASAALGGGPPLGPGSESGGERTTFKFAAWCVAAAPGRRPRGHWHGRSGRLGSPGCL
jgi:hypothetical protein